MLKFVLQSAAHVNSMIIIIVIMNWMYTEAYDVSETECIVEKNKMMEIDNGVLYGKVKVYCV